MASPNIAFDNIPASIRKPGKYFEFNTKLAVRTLPGNPQRVVLIGQRLSTGTIAAGQPVDIFDDGQARLYFGAGSILHLMARAAISAYPHLQLSAVALDDAATGGLAATGTVTVTGVATAPGVVAVNVANGARAVVAVSIGDKAETVATALKAALIQSNDLPVAASTNAAVLTLSAKNKGTLGNAIKIAATSTVAGITLAVKPMSGGATDPVLAPALTAIFAAGHNIIVTAYADKVSLTALRNHLDAVISPLEQRDAFGVYGHAGTLAEATTLAGTTNYGWITNAWLRGTSSLPYEIAAGYAAVTASEEDPARPLNTLEIKELNVPDVAQWASRKEQESALYNGVTPLEIGPGNKIQIVRAITTYTLDPQGVQDVALLDLTTIRTLAYARKAFRERIALRFPREKLSERTPPKVRSELLDVLYKMEELEIVEMVDAHKDGVLVERDTQDVNRLNARIPVDVVNGLHVFAGRIDLLL